MKSYPQNYIDGRWTDSRGGRRHSVVNPATEGQASEIVLGTAADVDLAVEAARRAFETFSQTDKQERMALIGKVIEAYKARIPDIAEAIATEMGCPISTASTAQAGSGVAHLGQALASLDAFEFSEKIGDNTVLREPIGVVALITPWNWPMNQIVAKVGPCLAAGCTMILKPSEEAPSSAAIFAEVMEAAGVPAGVFNLVQGDGAEVGTALARHPGIDMISFTGSTRAGIMVAKNAADTVKRVSQELGGKSPNIILEGTPLDVALPGGVGGVLLNSGQSCVAPTRMLVHRSQHDDAAEKVGEMFAAKPVGDPLSEGPHIGPVVNKAQYEKIQGLIQKGIEEGATLVTGGLGRPEGLDKGYYVKPTVFADVTPDMTIAQEEIFGPVLVIMPYDDEADAVRIANDTPYGLGAYIAGDPARAGKLVGKLRAGAVFVNSGGLAFDMPFGGYKQSGNGREFGKFGIEEFLEVKSVIGQYQPVEA
ncbi:MULTISPECIES: aldehyde dehydrogenase family protein [unclassified Novosphingobium]|uniref:aldehyde dehydrogenase family protein n=1 Tax=unclassified Novosphingobium TaxID=2644732 RepID=UPI0012CE9663|nr:MULTISPECIES: aldehyde dehydrogenase family protein [unclassified Novosphingobium]MPS69723.1 aldehyde dehydrogenase family protein [Novosphingobium sp.]WRT94980.1 aldehyde dehydrogenase family protein [Novosphingobium sp. RL4]